MNISTRIETSQNTKQHFKFCEFMHTCNTCTHECVSITCVHEFTKFKVLFSILQCLDPRIHAHTHTALTLPLFTSLTYIDTLIGIQWNSLTLCDHFWNILLQISDHPMVTRVSVNILNNKDTTKSIILRP